MPLFALLLLAGAPLGAIRVTTLEPATADRIDAEFSEWIAPDEPGGALLILRDSEEVFRGAWGLAQMELDVPADPSRIYAIGSLTKQFTATAALMLVDEGRLDLDATLAALVPGFALTGHGITVRNLLGHTSGLVNLANIPEWAATWGKPSTPDELIDLFRRKPPVDAPGARFEYNNSGYVLVGRAMELVTGRSWSELLNEKIFGPLGMTSTGANDTSEIVHGRVPGYARTASGWQNTKAELHFTQLYAAGALRSSLDDLARFHRALASGRILSTTTLEAMTTPGSLKDGRHTGYGAGWAVSRQRGRTVLEHGGASYGYYSAVVWLPEEKVWGAVMTNRYGFGDEARVRLARAVKLAAGWPEREAPATLASSQLDELAGTYLAEDERAVRMSVIREGDHMVTSRGEGGAQAAYPRSADQLFRSDGSEEIDVEREPSGAVSRLVTRRSYRGETYWRRSAETGAETRAATPATEPTPALVQPEIYVGRYELGSGLTAEIRLENGALVADVAGLTSVPLLPSGVHAFSFPSAFGTVVFDVRDGRALGLTFTQGGQETRGARVE